MESKPNDLCRSHDDLGQVPQLVAGSGQSPLVPPGHNPRGVAHAAGTSAPPSSETRTPICTYAACGSTRPPFAVLLEAQQLAECGVLLSVAVGVQAEDGRLGGWVRVREPQPQPTVGLRAVTPHRDIVRHAGVARSERGCAPSRTWASRT